MKPRRFKLTAAENGMNHHLEVDGVEVPRVRRVTVDAPANGPAELTVYQSHLPGTVEGEAVVRTVQELASRRAEEVQHAPTCRADVRPLAARVTAYAEHYLKPDLGTTTDLVAGSTVLPDGRRVRFLHVIDRLEGTS